MQNEMLAILTAFFLYYGDAGWVWWFVWGLVLCLYGVREINSVWNEKQKAIAEALKYWEGK